jgi:hypothetical protein
MEQSLNKESTATGVARKITWAAGVLDTLMKGTIMKTLMDLAAELQTLLNTVPIDHDCGAIDGCTTCQDFSDLYSIAQRNLKADQALLK